ncbi:LexA family transcriptional regulator [Pedobacter sp. Hv1]|uniref:LexA family protein n=1 Tax=Pedobacter sp. Hv1 TaxID=1740090 RepID=UPI000A6D3AB2|nr:S24 family peptidase [Pedobacter sp. Hv1]
MIRQIEIPRNEFIDTLPDPGKVSGFVSPAEDYKQRRLHIAQRIVNDPINTFYFEADDDQMKYFGIRKGSIIVVDKSVKVRSGNIVVCCVDDEWLTRKLCVRNSGTFLCINDSMGACINITGKDITVFGSVTWTCSPHNI